jgi:ketosteroid isomerase-like protein
MATNREIIERAYASFAQGDIPAALDAFADDIQWTEPDGYQLGGTYVGHRAVVDGVFMRLGEIGDEFAVVPEQFVVDRDTVVAIGRLSWKHKGTGESASVKMAHVWTFEGGKATTFEQLTDTVKVRELSS